MYKLEFQKLFLHELESLQSNPNRATVDNLIYIDLRSNKFFYLIYWKNGKIQKSINSFKKRKINKAPLSFCLGFDLFGSYITNTALTQ